MAHTAGNLQPPLIPDPGYPVPAYMYPCTNRYINIKKGFLKTRRKSTKTFKELTPDGEMSDVFLGFYFKTKQDIFSTKMTVTYLFICIYDVLDLTTF